MDEPRTKEVKNNYYKYYYCQDLAFFLSSPASRHTKITSHDESEPHLIDFCFERLRLGCWTWGRRAGVLAASE